MEIVKEIIEGKIEEWTNEGLSNDEIIARIGKLPLDKMYMHVINQGSKVLFNGLKEQVFEISTQHRADTNLFLAHHESIWNRCFAFSEAQYVLTLEIAEGYRKEVEAGIGTSDYEANKYSYMALVNIHGRACQVYLEILCLVENGFADGAFARWRTLYELGIIGDFIRSSGEETAKAFLEQASTNDQHYSWAKGAPCFTEKGPKFKAHFSDIEGVVSKEPRWRDCYKAACIVTHSSPQGTFKRLGTMNNGINVISVGRTDYGIEFAAINASSLLALLTVTFLGLFHSEESLRNSLFVSLWANAVNESYKEIANTAFKPDKDGNYHAKTDEMEG